MAIQATQPTGSFLTSYPWVSHSFLTLDFHSTTTQSTKPSLQSTNTLTLLPTGIQLEPAQLCTHRRNSLRPLRQHHLPHLRANRHRLHPRPQRPRAKLHPALRHQIHTQHPLPSLRRRTQRAYPARRACASCTSWCVGGRREWESGGSTGG